MESMTKYDVIFTFINDTVVTVTHPEKRQVLTSSVRQINDVTCIFIKWLPTTFWF